MKYNNELKKIDTQEKAYLLGFLYGDGTISNHIEKNGRERFLIKISITKNDIDLIETLYNKFPFFNKGEFDYSKYNKNSSKQVSIAKSSKELYYDLLLNGVYPRKSYENKDKLKLPNIDDTLMPHFIRGFFDADGSVYVQKNRPNLIRIEFCSVSFGFLTEIESYLKKYNINSWKIVTRQPSGKGKQEYYILYILQTSETQKLIKYMYHDANVKLKRKAEICLEYKPVNSVLDRNMMCNFCGSHFVNKNGNRGNSTRFRCKDCGRGFSVHNS